MRLDFSHLQSVEGSDTGRRRSENQDTVLRLPEAGLFCVADGMGGAMGGGVASRWVAEELLRPQYGIEAIPTQDSLQKIINIASKRIVDYATAAGHKGTGSTVVMLVFDPDHSDRAFILHAGDSRAYLLRKGKLSQVSVDHSMATAAGVKDDRQLPAAYRGVITRAVGVKEEVQLERTNIPLHGGDLFMLCSDGLSRMVSDRKIRKMLKAGGSDLSALAAALIEAANDAGGEDNISVVLVQVPPRLPARSAREAGVQREAMDEEVETARTANHNNCLVDSEASGDNSKEEKG